LQTVITLANATFQKVRVLSKKELKQMQSNRQLIPSCS